LDAPLWVAITMDTVVALLACGGTEGTAGAEADVVQKDEQNVRSPLWRQQRINGG
jgi:hypothetical protein